MGFIARIAGFASGNSASAATGAVSAATSGSGSLLVSVGFGNQGGSVSSVTDTQGNIYVQDYALPSGSTGGRGLEVWRCASLRALTTSDSLTVTLSATQDHTIDVIVDQVSAVAAPDAANYAYASSPTATSLSCTATLTAADTLAYTVVAMNGAETSASVSGGSFTTTGSVVNPALTACVSLTAASWAPPSSGSQTANWSWPVSHTAVAVTIGYPPGPSLVPSQPPATSVSRRDLRQRARAKVGPSAVAAGPAAGAQPLTAPALPVTAQMGPVTLTGAVTIVQQASGSSQYDYGLSTLPLTTTAGNTLVLLAGWDLSTSYTAAPMPAIWQITDSAGNVWHHAGTSSGGVSGARATAWICTNSRPVSWISVSLTTFASSLAYTVLEMANMPANYSLDVSAANATPSGTSLTVNPGVTSAADLAFTVLATGAASLAPATPPGWNALATVTSGAAGFNPVEIFPFWGPAAPGQSLGITWSVARAAPLAGVTFAIKASALPPVQPNPGMPLLAAEAAFGFVAGDPSQSPPSWTDITTRAIAKDGSQFLTSVAGREYEMSTPEAGELTLALLNADGAFTPGNTSSPYAPGTGVTLKTPIRVKAYWAGQWYWLGSGWVERWPQDWPDLPQWGMSNMVATDAVAAMAGVSMSAALDADILIDSPYVFIQASEQYLSYSNGVSASGVLNAASAKDPQGLIAANTSRLNQQPAFYVDGTAAPGATGQTTYMLGDADTGFGTTAITTAPTVAASGPGIIYTDPSMPSPRSPYGVSVEFWVVIAAVAPSASLAPVVFSTYGPTSTYAVKNPSLQVQVNNATGGNTITVTLADGTAVTAPFSVSASPQQIVLGLTASSLSISVNGTLQATTGLTSGQTTVWNAVSLGCPNYATQAGAITVGNFAVFDFALYAYQLPVQRIKSHYVTGADGQQGIDATMRLAQIMAWANLGIPRAGPVTFAGAAAAVTEGPAYDYAGKTATDAANQLAVNEAGMLYVSPNGAMTFLHREALFNLPSQVTFGDSVHVTDAQIPYLPRSGFDYDDTRLYSTVTIALQVGQNTTLTVTTNELASILAYFQRAPLQQTIQTTSDLDPYWISQWYAAKYSQPSIRVRTVVIDAAANPAAFPAVLSVQQGQAATVTRNPVGGAPITETCLVQRIEHKVGPDFWQVTLQLSPYTPDNAVLQLDVSPFSTLGGSTLA